MRNACDSDSRCGLACDASARDAKSLVMWVARCEALSSRAVPCLCLRVVVPLTQGPGSLRSGNARKMVYNVQMDAAVLGDGLPTLRELESERVFVSQERVSGFPEKGLTSGEVRGNFRGSPGNFRGSLGNFRGTWIAVKFHSERTSGEVAKKLPGKFGELPGKSGDFPEARGSLTPFQRLAKFVSNESACRVGIL